LHFNRRAPATGLAFHPWRHHVEAIGIAEKRYAEDPEYREGVLAGKRARHAICKTDINALRRLRYATDPEYRQQFLDRDPIKVRERELKRKYGISLQDYDAMLAQQHAACAICRRTFDRTPCVDHCHATRVVRGLLCSKCNQGLGCFDDDIDRMRAAADYLRRPPSSIVVRPRRDRAVRGPAGGEKAEDIRAGAPSAPEAKSRAPCASEESNTQMRRELAATLPWRRRHRRPSAAVLSGKNADAVASAIAAVEALAETVAPGWGETRHTGTARGVHPTPLAGSR
jgi:hypothetical protein